MYLRASFEKRTSHLDEDNVTIDIGTDKKTKPQPRFLVEPTRSRHQALLCCTPILSQLLLA